MSTADRALGIGAHGAHQVAGPETPPSPVGRHVAGRFYLKNQSEADIARVNISRHARARFKVTRLLDVAVARDIVRIDINVPAEIDAPLSQALTKHVASRNPVIVRLTHCEGGVSASTDPRQVLRWLSTAAAQLLLRTAEEGDVLSLDGNRAVERWGLAVPVEGADSEVAQAGHGAGQGAGMDLGVELAEGSLTYVVQEVLDAPVASGPQ
ncbi:hypothetical protein ABZT03_40620 [Streptomyces sp. NPDC005574]|uniref:hypothetical protein n=1 Tax=Streptomyces sp. NPDC005574 TaxID=3156891 RepID=UPI0033B4CA8E